jgi:hypothetical protein
MWQTGDCQRYTNFTRSHTVDGKEDPTIRIKEPNTQTKALFVKGKKIN